MRLTAEVLRERSGLTAADHEALLDAGLLVPGPEGLYSARTATWARKLAGLLDAGWTVAEVKAWTLTRWGQADPRVPVRPGSRARQTGWANAGNTTEVP